MPVMTPTGPPQPPPQPPRHFNAREVAEWRMITDRLPADFFPKESWPLLASYVSISCQLETLAAELSKFTSLPSESEPERKAHWEKLTTVRGPLVMQLASLSSKLRIAPSSYNKRDRTKRAAQSGGRKPWEFGTEDLDS